MYEVTRSTTLGRVLLLTILAGFLAPAATAETERPRMKYTAQVDGLACPFCAYGIEKQLMRIKGVESVETDIKSGLVIIIMQPGAALHEADANRAVEAAGFTMRNFQKKE